MLRNIEYVEDARRILTLLCFALVPLTVQELIDGIAVEINNSTGLNRKRRLQDFNGIRDICGGFIDIGPSPNYATGTYHEEDLTATVRIAHFSVQEYLVSERIRDQKAAKFSLASVTAHAEITQICLVYLLDPGLLNANPGQSLSKEFPLARFAAVFWYFHYKRMVTPVPGVDNCILRLFQCQDSFVTWVKLKEVNRHRDEFSRHLLKDIPAPVYWASLLGLDQVLHELIHTDQLKSTNISALSLASTSKVSKEMNAQGRTFDKALLAAATNGHNKVVQMLLDNGADVNTQGGTFRNALQAASFKGGEKVIQMLLDNGADVNARGGRFGNALQTASRNGHDKIVQMLLDNGADVNAQGGRFGNALQTASRNGHDKIVQMLLDNGADIHAGGDYGALCDASQFGHNKILQMLLDKMHAADFDKAWRAAFSSKSNRLARILQTHEPALRRKPLVTEMA